MQFPVLPRFKLIYLFWTISLVAAALAKFGTLGFAVVIAVCLFWFVVWLNVIGRAGFANEATLLIAVMCVLVTLLLPTVSSPHPAQPRNICSNHLRQIQLALLNYELANGTFPPTYIADESGKPLHSWRVLILPYIEEQALYGRYNFNEPWDSPSNAKLLKETPPAYQCPSHDDELCRYVAVTGEDSAWRADDSVRIDEFTGGTANCVMVTETLKGVPWTKPEDITPDEFLEVAIKLGQSRKAGGHRSKTGRSLYTSYADGHVDRIDVPQQAHWLAALSRRSIEMDRNSLEPRQFEPIEFRESSLSGWVLLVLSLMPAIPIAKLHLVRNTQSAI